MLVINNFIKILTKIVRINLVDFKASNLLNSWFCK